MAMARSRSRPPSPDYARRQDDQRNAGNIHRPLDEITEFILDPSPDCGCANCARNPPHRHAPSSARRGVPGTDTKRRVLCLDPGAPLRDQSCTHRRCICLRNSRNRRGYDAVCVRIRHGGGCHPDLGTRPHEADPKIPAISSSMTRVKRAGPGFMDCSANRSHDFPASVSQPACLRFGEATPNRQYSSDVAKLNAPSWLRDDDWTNDYLLVSGTLQTALR